MKSLVFSLSVVFAAVVFGATPKYVFLFIGDGMSTPQRMVAEEFSRAIGEGTLAMNALPFQATTRTCSADSLVTDSAAAATAIACGEKTNNHYSGVDPEGKPVYSCAVAAQEAGKKVGIVSTVTITHATPAGFYAHRKSRGDLYGIALDLANSGFDYFAGGGLDNRFDDKTHSEYCGNAYDYAAQKGYRIVKTRDEFLALQPSDGKILTRFRDGALDNAIDITEVKDPSLDELVAKAIEMLDNEKGFFLMAEGGRVDWAGHANDAATNLREVLALDKAVKVALAFQEKHPEETLVVVTGDHETGGLSMGFAGTGYAIFPERLSEQTMSVGTFESRVKKLFEKNPNLSFDEIKPLVSEAFGFKFKGPDVKNNDPMRLHSAEEKELRTAFEHDVAFHKSKVEENTKYDGEKRYLFGGACRIVMSHKCGLGWSSGAHTAMPVLTTAKGCCAEQFVGFIENTDIAKKIKAFYKK